MKLFLFTLIYFFPINAYSYLDPGTFGIIINAIIGFFATVIAYILLYFNRFKIFIKNIYQKYKKKSKT